MIDFGILKQSYRAIFRHDFTSIRQKSEQEKEMKIKN